MQPTSRVSGFESTNNADYEPSDVFCGLASLIVEGRLPRHDGRGYGEGTHVPIGTKGPRHHVCSEENTMVRFEAESRPSNDILTSSLSKRQRKPPMRVGIRVGPILKK